MFPDEIKEIDKTKYISSIGLMKACDDNLAINYIDPWDLTIDWDKLINANNPNCCICVKMTHLNKFSTIYDQIPYNYTLLTCDGHDFLRCNYISEHVFARMINSDKINKWCSVNCHPSMHEKLELVPIGLNYHCEAFWGKPKVSPADQEQLLIDIKSGSKHFSERSPLCYSNFHFALYNTFGNDRLQAINGIPKSVMFYEPEKLPRDKCWKKMTQYSFVVSPHGVGMDCIRMWEALILGCIVIVKSSSLDPLYENLPVLIVDQWSDVTESLLKETLEKFSDQEFEYDKLTLKYWVDKIKC